MFDVPDKLKNNFYELVVPSLADPIVIKSISESPRYLCLFKSCKDLQKSFASKQKFIQHLTICHDQELPKGGSFIAPNDKSTVPGGFWCSKCGHHYCRRDHLQKHFKSSQHCRDADVSLINPVEMHELKYEEQLAIKGPSIPKLDKFDFKPNKCLAIEWKPNESNNLEHKKEPIKTKIGNMLNKISKSFSMISISDSSKNARKFKTKSKTFLNIFSVNDASKCEISVKQERGVEKRAKRSIESDDESEQKLKIVKLATIKEEVESSDRSIEKKEDEDDDELLKEMDIEVIESDSNSVEFDEKSLIILEDETVSSDLDHSDLAFIDESERSI
ncbi:unnamed protein product, partial [Brachionus calyciflorus]